MRIKSDYIGKSVSSRDKYMHDSHQCLFINGEMKTSTPNVG